MEWRRKKIVIIICMCLILAVISVRLRSSNTTTIADISGIPIYSVQRDDKAVALTFDINWAEKDNIYSILDTLEKYNVKGTFFIIGKWVQYSEENTKKLLAIYERGHEIGNHSYTHCDFSTINKTNIEEELKKTDKVIEEYTKEKPKIFRFPSGSYNEEAVRIVKDLGYIPVQWDVDSVDWKEIGAEVEYKRVRENIKSGSIVLFHNNAKYTPENLDKLLKELKKEGYNFGTVSEIIYEKNYYIDNSGMQIKKN
ncbi:polysaccharide deacetylase family protein [Clostridium sp. MSJ-8]|uniref:polysaccharide deacetylase family protein n=1 Tax=Clostridium sp. MSJ-8 TaxID=2841510 RepID=UPI001C0EA2FF|nr:polysaccharide deacetylase family protein [Clostridium sp. MSJ-8]